MDNVVQILEWFGNEYTWFHDKSDKNIVQNQIWRKLGSFDSLFMTLSGFANGSRNLTTHYDTRDLVEALRITADNLEKTIRDSP